MLSNLPSIHDLSKDPVRYVAKASDNLRPQVRFIIHSEGQDQRPPALP